MCSGSAGGRAVRRVRQYGLTRVSSVRRVDAAGSSARWVAEISCPGFVRRSRGADVRAVARGAAATGVEIGVVVGGGNDDEQLKSASITHATITSNQFFVYQSVSQMRFLKLILFIKYKKYEK